MRDRKGCGQSKQARNRAQHKCSQLLLSLRHILKTMAKKKFRITESDFLLANRKASREEELERHGKQIIFRTTTQKSKKVYDRKRLKKADINHDDLPFW